MPKRQKYIYDPIHGSIPLHGAVLDLVGHPLVQRLWGIRQTGMAHLVFPGASHTRLEHSLGVLYVTRELSSRLGLSEEKSRLEEIAGLLHDIGHTPFSHSLEGPLVEATGMNHEGRTAGLIADGTPKELLCYGSGIAGYSPTSIPELLEQHGIDPSEIAGLLRRGGRKPGYLTEMLHGTIDADRLDYLERDAHYTGVAQGVIDSSRIIETARRAKGHLAFAEKGLAAVEAFLLARGHMYVSVYCNKTVRIAEAMLQSAVERAPGFPDSGRELLAKTDGELLAALESLDGRPKEMVHRLMSRALYKLAFVVREGEVSPRWADHLTRRPAERRRIEDELAGALKAKSGDVVIDVLNPLELPGADVRIVEREGRLRFLLDEDEALSRLLGRSPTGWLAAIYVAPRSRERAEKSKQTLLKYFD